MDSGQSTRAAREFGQAIDRLRGLARKAPDEPAYRHELARALINRGVLYRQGRSREAEQDYRAAIRLLEGLKGERRSRAATRHELAVAYNNLGNLFFHAARYAEARPANEQALALLRQLVVDFPSRPAYRHDLANVRNSLGAVLGRLNLSSQAQEQWALARDLFADLFRDFPQTVSYRFNLAMTLGNLGWLQLLQDNPAAGRPFLEESLGHLEALLRANPGHPAYQEVMRNQQRDLAQALVRLGQHDAAHQRAGRLARTFPDYHGPLFAAAFLACCAVATGEANLPCVQRQALRQGYTTDALEQLREARHRGYRPADRLQGDPDLRGLRGHPGFQELLGRLR